MRVLIVDDDEIALELLGAAIASAGYEVSTASDGCEALEILRTGVFRVVITDWEMPNMNGIELCRKIRERQSSSYVYVILVTSREGAQPFKTSRHAPAMGSSLMLLWSMGGMHRHGPERRTAGIV